MNSPSFVDRLSRDYESASLFAEMFNVSEHTAHAAIEMLIFPLNPVGSRKMPRSHRRSGLLSEKKEK